MTGDTRHRHLEPVVLPFAVSRLLLFATSYACLRFFPTHTMEPWQGDAFPGVNWINGWVRWDSMWYEAIIDSQARLLPQDFSSANFFPLYSWITWIVGLPFRPFLSLSSAFFVAGLLVSHAAFFAGLVGVHRLTTDATDEETATRTIWLMAFFPFSFFFAAVYADALYLCVVVWCFWFARRRRWPAAGLLAALAAMTRVPGFAVLPALAAEFLVAVRNRRTDVARSVVPILIVAAAPLILAAYFAVRYGSPIAFVFARQQGWHRATGLAAFRADFDYFTEGSLFACAGVADCLRDWTMTRKLVGEWYLGLIPASVALVTTAARTVGIGPTVWALGSIVMALLNGLDGTGRFTAVSFPVFVGLALLVRRRSSVLVVCAIFLPFLLLFASQFARWRPIL